MGLAKGAAAAAAAVAACASADVDAHGAPDSAAALLVPAATAEQRLRVAGASRWHQHHSPTLSNPAV